MPMAFHIQAYLNLCNAYKYTTDACAAIFLPGATTLIATET